jgi:glycosyltransferase involved in cell wall biosynthesis
MEHAAGVVADLTGRGISGIRLTVTMDTVDEMRLADTRQWLTGLAGVAVDVVPLPKGDELTAALHRTDLVLVGSGRPGFDHAFVAAAEHGIPVLVDGRSDAGGLLTDGQRVPDHLGGPATVGRSGGTAEVRAWADRVQGALHDLGGERVRALGLREHLTGRYDSPSSAHEFHEALRGTGTRLSRVDDAAWQRALNPREVVLRRAGDLAPPADGRTRVMTTCTEWYSKLGGVITANRELTESFRAAGAETYSRVSIVDTEDATHTSAELVSGVHVVGAPHVWGVLDEKGGPDTRAMIMLLDNLPPHVDVVVGHSRFSGGAATWLVDHVYPDAKYVHVLHTSPELLDALRGNEAEGLRHAQTERQLMARADLVSGVGPLLWHEAARLSAEARPGDRPPVHEIISDMPASETLPPSRPADRSGFEIAVQGRAGDPIKGVIFAARMVAELRAQGVDARLTVRGAKTVESAEQQRRLLSAIAGVDVQVKLFTTDPAELVADLHHADLMLMPSIHEGFGLVASEAARAGVPVLVGEGTGAGMFFGDRRYVPAELGDPATVRDGVTLQALREALQAVTAPDGTRSEEAVRVAVDQIDEDRMQPWVEHVRAALADLDGHRQRAAALRTYLDSQFPLGTAGRQLLAALASGEGRGIETAMQSSRGSGQVGAVLRGPVQPDPSGHSEPSPRGGQEQPRGRHRSTHGLALPDGTA